MNEHPATLTTAIVAEPDLLIVGGSTAAVAAALSAADLGLRVLLATSRTYLGDDVTAVLRLADDPGTPTTTLARRLFAGGVPTPMHVKETLERELLHAGVEVLYGCHPGGVLLDADGRVAGAAILSRAGRHAITAGAVIDATPTGLVARQAGCRLDGAAATLACAWTLSAPTCPEGAAPAGTVVWRVDNGAVRELPLWRHTFEATIHLTDPASLAAVEVEARRRYFHPEQHFTADAVDYRHTARLVDGIAGLWALSPVAGLSAQACAAIAAGDDLGRAIAASAPSQPAGPLTWRCAGAEPVEGLYLDGRDLRGAPAEGLPRLHLPAALPVLGAAEVLVVGGGTAGAPAGIAAGREGRRTLLVESLPGMGGLGTWGQISKYYHGYREGFTAEVDAGVASMGPEAMRLPRGTWRVEWKRTWWLRALGEANTEVWTDTLACGAQVTDARVTGVVVAGPAGCGLVQAGCVVDSTGAGDIAAAAGAGVLQPGVERAAVQGTGLSPREPGRDYANSDHTFSDDGDVRDVTRSFVAARRKFRERFDLAPILSSRERRRIQAEVMVQPEDIFFGRTWPDAINLAQSNFDTHGFTCHPMFTALPPTHEPYRAPVPLRALLPVGLEGILVTGLGIGAHRDAMPVLRMQPCVQNQGYAAGLVAAASVGTPVRAVDLPAIQARLIAQGILDESARAADPFPVADAVLDAAVAAEPPTHPNLAVLFAHRDRAVPRLRAALAAATDLARREWCALLLGLMGDSSGAEVLAAALNARAWDQGWNFRGMDQFGPSRSPVDSLLWAAAGAPAPVLYPAVLAKLETLAAWRTLTANPELSHAQAMAAACAAYAAFDTERKFPPLLARMLTFHQIGGNHQTDWEAVFSDQPRCVNHNEARSRALRELAVAAGLVQCGDHESNGLRVLRHYAADWRGPLAHHARAVLAACTLAASPE